MVGKIGAIEGRAFGTAVGEAVSDGALLKFRAATGGKLGGEAAGAAAGSCGRVSSVGCCLAAVGVNGTLCVSLRSVLAINPAPRI